METKETKIVVMSGVLAGLLILPLVVHSGNLEPSGPPNSTMKTLGEIEPGTPISSVPYTIAESGSYYLSVNAQTTSNLFSGITIWADNVTLDLKGFSLIGEGTAGLHGVNIEGDYKNITIRNGTITNWGGNGVEGLTATNCRAEDLQVIDNAGSGIHLPAKHHRVENCMVSGNGSSSSNEVYGIKAGNGSVVTGNTSSDNGNLATGDVYGIYASTASTVTGNTGYHNGNDADGDVYGIYAGTASTVSGNTVYYNGYSAGGDAYGVYAVFGSTVSGNTSYYNGNSAGGKVYGIHAGVGSTVTGNTSRNNGFSATGPIYGIYLAGYNLVDQNTSYSNNGTNMDTSVGGCVYGNNVAP